MKTLVIAEKPSVARDLASALGKVPKKGDYYENDQYLVAAALGHLVELEMPEDIDKKLSYWRMESLPIIPESFGLKPIERTKSKFQELKKHLKNKEVGEVVNACDAGREGELIFTYLCQLAKNKKPVKRLWLSSMTQAAIRSAFQKLRPGEEMEPLADAARCRSESDWLVGINGTRAVTKRIFGSRAGQVATVGRVQTPTLTMLMDREKKIREFEPRTYFRIVGQFGITSGQYEGVYQKPDFKKGDDEHNRADRIWDREAAEQILAEVHEAPQAEVSEEKKRTTQASPRLYDLTTLQREANSRFGLPAGKTLRIAQALYERHKMITYPRTDSRALPEDYPQVCIRTLGNLDAPWKALAAKAVENKWIRPNKRIFDNSKISDHFAIIPTESPARKLDPDEAKVYDLITRRFIAVFYPPAEFDVTTRISVAAGHSFKTEGKVLAKAGWLEVYQKGPRAEQPADTLPPITPEDGSNSARADIVSLELAEDQTRPPPRYTEATLLSAMEGAGKLLDDEELAEAMKEKGLGTPATRASIIDHLIREKYLERQGREIVPTGKAETLLGFLHEIKIDVLTDPGMTGEWEYKLRRMEEGGYPRDTFMKEIVDLTKTIVDRTKNFEEKQEDATESSIVSPTDKKPMMENFRSYRSQDGEITVYKVIGNRRMKEEEIQQVLNEGKIGPIDGFLSKAGKPFSAMLQFDEEEKKVKFLFDRGPGEGGEDEKDLDLSQFPVIGNFPLDNSPVHETPNAYISESYERGSGKKQKGFRLSRTMLGKTLPAEEVKKLLTERKTGLIEGFRSKRTKRLFSAHLLLKEDGGIGFEFPPRAPKKKTAKKVAAKKAAKKSAAKKTTKQD
ncbi:MAG: DNA topoisomerase III [Opitutales bacterium]|nr:DNA topoisomerase III [Opitutales bacterium]